jgi:methionine synthase II (cobalamin-independent)
MPLPFLATSLVGSYAQPAWLIDRKELARRFPPRVRAKELWRVAPEWLDEAQDDATRIAILDRDRTGLDIVTDGEMGRESYLNRFATALEGADIVQIDEPYMQARPEKARQFGLEAFNAALAGVTGTTAVHICFGYAAVIHVRPSGYSFLPEFANSPVKQVSIETAQSGLDCAVLEKLSGKATARPIESHNERL